MSVSEFARHRGVSAEAVSLAITDGRIKTEPDGSIEVTQADIDWERNTRKARRDPKVDVAAGTKRRETWAKKNSARAEIAAADSGALESNSMSYADARAYEQNINAKLKQIELEQRQGSVLPREAVAQTLETLFRVHRDAILNIPNRVAAQVFEQTSIADVHAMLENELRVTLDELADGLTKLAEGQSKAA
jgi:hypothetical protein